MASKPLRTSAHPSTQITEFQPRAEDRLRMRAVQLSSLMTIITGNGRESFVSWNGTIQENVLWLASDMADEIDVLSKEVCS